MQQCLCSRKSPTECKRGIYQLSQHQISLPHNSHHRPYRFTALRQHRSLFMLPMQTWSVLLLLASLIGACLATLEDHKNIVYVVPRPGIDKKVRTLPPLWSPHKSIPSCVIPNLDRLLYQLIPSRDRARSPNHARAGRHHNRHDQCLAVGRSALPIFEGIGQL